MGYKRANPFYLSKEWRRLRKEVLEDDKYECQLHKQRGFYKQANTVHHVKTVEEHPELALEKYYIDECGRRIRNLISLCKECHEEVHGHRHKPKEYLTEERW